MELNKAQRKFINSKPNGHMLLKGPLGTGKTTALINKAPSIIDRYCITNDDKLLIVTNNDEHTKKLTSIYRNIEKEKYHQNSFFDQDKSDRLEIHTIDSLLRYYLNKFNKSLKRKLEIASLKECNTALKNAMKTIENKYENQKFVILDIEFIKEEIQWIKACNYVAFEEYKEANRTGRLCNIGGSIPKIIKKNSKQRQVVYEILVEYNKNLKNKNLVDFNDIALIALEEAKRNPEINYTHIFIDNTHDLTKVQLDFLKAIYNQKSYSSIIFAVDNFQYNNPYAWLTKGRTFASLGYDMKGKSFSLRENYIENIKNLSEPKIELITENIKNKNNLVDNVFNSKLSLDTIEYIDLKRKVTHKFVKEYVNSDEIYINYDGNHEKAEDIISIPVFSEIAAGSPILINESIEDNYSLPKEWIRNPKDAFILKVKGDSMINRNISDGDYVVINKQNIPSINDIVAVDIEGEATLKTYKIVNKKIVLMPENSNYEPIVIEDQQFNFIGVAIGLIKST